MLDKNTRKYILVIAMMTALTYLVYQIGGRNLYALVIGFAISVAIVKVMVLPLFENSSDSENK